MSETTNINLHKLSGSEKVDFNVLNDNYDKIDTAMLKLVKTKAYLSSKSTDNANFASATNPNWSYIRFSDGTTICWMTIKLSTGTCKAWGSTGLFRSDLVIAKAFPRTFRNPPVVSVQWGQTGSNRTTVSGMLFTVPTSDRDLLKFCPVIRAIFASNQSNKNAVISVMAIGTAA